MPRTQSWLLLLYKTKAWSNSLNRSADVRKGHPAFTNPGFYAICRLTECNASKMRCSALPRASKHKHTPKVWQPSAGMRDRHDMHTCGWNHLMTKDSHKANIPTGNNHRKMQTTAIRQSGICITIKWQASLKQVEFPVHHQSTIVYCVFAMINLPHFIPPLSQSVPCTYPS